METFTITLSLDTINVVLAALGEQPAKTVYDIITDIRAQTLAAIASKSDEPLELDKEAEVTE